MTETDQGQGTGMQTQVHIGIHHLIELKRYTYISNYHLSEQGSAGGGGGQHSGFGGSGQAGSGGGGQAGSGGGQSGSFGG